MNIGFELKQSQKLTQKLSQKMIQAVNILQMNADSLNEYIMEEYMKNPVLELNKNNHVTDWEQFSKKSRYRYTESNYNDADDWADDQLTPCVNNITFMDDLFIQWHAKKYEHNIETIGEWFIYNINSKGYMDGDIATYSEDNKIPMDQLEAVLAKVQELEPAGIASRNLSERLFIQLRKRNKNDSVLEALINNYLELLGNKKWNEICKELKISKEKLKGYIDTIQKLNPVINVEDGESQTVYIEPQVKVIVSDGVYDIEYLGEKEMTLFIPDFYKSLIVKEDTDDTTKEYLKNNMDRAAWLIRNIEERKQNIMNISKCIINKQLDFIKYGKTYMKSMTQKEVADVLNISVSTVSRVVNGKYIDTPQGIYELKYFFSSGIDSNNDDVSAIAIKNKISELIDEEDKRHPLSDEKIKKLLTKWEILISRRTVAKYRISLGILNASKRKEL